MTGDEIWSPSLIAKNYGLSLIFFIDVISTYPFEAHHISGLAG